MEALIYSTVLVVLAEMGDKTQLLGMAFATKYRARVVLAGVLVATLLNHLLAVVIGDYLTKIVPLSYIQLAAALSFVFFGLWTLRGDSLEGEDKKIYFTPFWTVTIAFFIAEMGDKTQLAAVALAAKYQSILWVWIGSTIGMMISNIIGIAIGVVMGRKIPEKLVKSVSAGIFIVFGYIGTWQAVEGDMLRVGLMAALTAVVAGYALFLFQQGRKTKVNNRNTLK